MMLPKIITTLLLFSSLGESKAKKHKGKDPKLKYGSQGNKIALCIDGDECNRLMQMKLNRLFEIDANGTDVGNAAKNFNNPNFVSYDWSAPEDILLDDNSTDVIGTRIRLDTDLLIGKLKDGKYASFTLITDFFYNDTEVNYGNETINVAAGSMKFSILVGNWPWASEDNGLAFGVKLKVKTRTGKDAPNNPKRRQRENNGTASIIIEQLELGDGMFIDSPLTAIIDDESFGSVTTTVEAATDDDGISIDWILPHFNTTLYYDPVMAEGQEQQQEQNNEEREGEGGDKEQEHEKNDEESEQQQQQEDEGEDDDNSGVSLSMLCPLLGILLYSVLVS